MLLRFIAENIFSFKDATEFNTFPSSKSHSHEYHKIVCSHATALRLAGIYGANGAGKSNLLLAIRLLRKAVISGTLDKVAGNDDMAFRFDISCSDKPSGLAIEFFQSERIFYYHLEFKGREVVFEELLLSKKTKDIMVFRREGSKIELNGDLLSIGLNSQFMDALDRLVRPDMLLLSFLGKYYPTEVVLVADAYSWFTTRIRIILPETISGQVPHLLDSLSSFKQLVNNTIPELKTGISSLDVEKVVISEESVKGNPLLLESIREAKNNPGEPQITVGERVGEISNVVYENGQVWRKTLVSIHQDISGNSYSVPVSIESDGTQRLIEYMPLFFGVIHNDGVYIVDEIERSIHPIMIKSIMQKISEQENAGGQLIFTTHESCLLDQDIFRPDEIWFAQKDSEQATKLYPLSDFNIHNTANIENGYLAGRYGGIPFLSNLKDLHW